MPKPRVVIDLIFDTLAHAQAVRDAILTRLVGEPVTDPPGVALVMDRGQPRLIVDIRVPLTVNRDALHDFIKTKMQDSVIATWIVRGRLYRHVCSHADADVQDCRTTDYTEITV